MAATHGSIRVLIADDHAVLRDGLRAFLGKDPGIEVVGEAEDGMDAVEKAVSLQPDVILMDIAMPRLGGLEAAGSELISAIRAVYAGKSFLAPSATRAVIDRYLNEAEPGDPESRFDRLSDREKEVLKLLAEGSSNSEIADLLCLSVKTVMSHRANIMEKLDIHSRTDLVKFAIRAGLLVMDD
jgi:DNA-binding NarL/FixJ family response regulator